MTTTLAPSPLFRSWDNNGNPLIGGQLFTYSAGTTTPTPSYTDSTGSTQNSNPVILNSRGEASVWLTPNVAYKLQLQDSVGNTIWTVDQVINAQLISLYGGVDTGSANAFVLNFTAAFTSLTDGIIIYWVPSNANTTASTLNANGLGIIPIVNSDGSALRAGEITANQIVAVMYKGGSFYLITSSLANQVLAINGAVSAPSIGWQNATTSGFFLANPSTGEIGVAFAGSLGGNLITGKSATGTVTGVTGTSSITVAYSLNLNTATALIPCFSGTGSGTAFTISFTDASLFLPTNRPQWVMIPSAQDNGSNLYAQTAVLTNVGSPTTSVLLTLNKNGNPAGWVATNTRGLGDSASANQYMPISWVVAGTS